MVARRIIRMLEEFLGPAGKDLREQPLPECSGDETDLGLVDHVEIEAIPGSLPGNHWQEDWCPVRAISEDAA